MKKGRYYNQVKPKSISSIIAKATKAKEAERLAKTRREYEKELKAEHEEIKKILSSTSYLKERTKSLFNGGIERTTRSIRIKQVNYTSRGLNKIVISALFNFRQKKTLS